MQFYTIKDYFVIFGNLKNITIGEGWGWFIDIESNYNEDPFPFKNKFISHSYNHVCIPLTINETPSMRSFTSMMNLHDETIINKRDEDDLENEFKHNYQFLDYIMNSVCILGVIGLLWL